MRKALEYTTVWSVGAVGYSVIELLWRGFTHWTMGITGGICFVAIYLIEQIGSGSPLYKRCFAESLAITLTELAVGFVVNLLLGWQVWDYSDMFCNFLGQICLLYTLLWFLLSIPAGYLCTILRRMFQSGFTMKSSIGCSKPGKSQINPPQSR